MVDRQPRVGLEVGFQVELLKNKETAGICFLDLEEKSECLLNAFLIALIVGVSVLMSTLVFAQSECRFSHWKSYKSTKLLSHQTTSAYLYSSTHMAIDADGAPNAYHPDDIGLDYLKNAGYPNKSSWSSILVPDRENPRRAYTQMSGEFAGYFVSKTSLEDKSKVVNDPTRYVDARNTPYLVFPGSFYRMIGTGQLGDLGYAINLSTENKASFVVADIGPSNARLGEISIALARELGGENVNPRNGAGAPRGEMLYIVFPYSSRKHSWPLRVDEIARHTNSLIEEVGGIESIIACKNAL